MKRSMMVIAIINIAILSGLQTASAQLPGIEGAAFANFLYDQTPKIYSINTSQTPTGISVSAKVANDLEKTDDMTEAVWVLYSTNEGKKWERANLTPDAKDDTLWRGEIPVNTPGAKVIYYLQAVDSAGNKTSEMPGMNTVWPPNEVDNLFPVLCDAGTDRDDDVKQVIDDLDILQLAAGYDDKYIYGKLTVQGKIDGGKLTPSVQVNAYLVGCFNIDKGEDILKATGLVNIPLASQFPKDTLDGFGITKMPAMIDARAVQTKKAIPEEEGGAEAEVVGNSMYFRFLRSVLGENKSGQLKFLSITGHSTTTDISQLMSGTGLVPGDASTYLYVYLRNNTFEVR